MVPQCDIINWVCTYGLGQILTLPRFVPQYKAIRHTAAITIQRLRSMRYRILDGKHVHWSLCLCLPNHSIGMKRSIPQVPTSSFVIPSLQDDSIVFILRQVKTHVVIQGIFRSMLTATFRMGLTSSQTCSAWPALRINNQSIPSFHGCFLTRLPRSVVLSDSPFPICAMQSYPPSKMED